MVIYTIAYDLKTNHVQNNEFTKHSAIFRVDDAGIVRRIKPSKYGRKPSLNRPVGAPGGKDGRLQTKFENYLYTVHTIAFCLYHGRWPLPGLVLDHLNGVVTDNRRENLREGTVKDSNQNRHNLNRNNTSGATGVSFDKRHNKWRALLRISNEFYGCSYHDTFEEAVEARFNFEMQYRKQTINSS